MNELFLLAIGVVAGFIDSIAGGGGLITVPSLSLFLGLSSLTIGTNKIAGTISALVALTIYSFKGHMDWKRGWIFTGFIALGSYFGSFINPWVPTDWFRMFLILTCPLLLWILWRKDFWIKKEEDHSSTAGSQTGLIILLAFLCGFYDGVWGPGGGTFMFLSLFFVAKFPLLTALAISKLANATSAGISLFNFSRQGNVNWRVGNLLSLGILFGALAGSSLASRRASRIVRPVLIVVVVLLISKVLFQ